MLRTVFVLVILIPGMAAAVASRFAALLVYLWFSLFRPQEWLWVDITPLRLSLLLSLLVVIPRGWLLSDFVNALPLKRRLALEAWPNLSHPLTVGTALFLVTALAAQPGAYNQTLGWQWLDYLWRLLLVSMVAVSLINTRQRFMAVITVSAASIGFHSARAGVASLFGGGVRFGAGLGGAYVDNNGWAMAIVMVLPFLVAVGQNTDRRLLRWLLWASIVPSFYTIISTFSRAGFLGAVSVTVVLAALQRRRAAALGALALIGLLAYVVVPMPAGYSDRVQTIQTYQDVGEESALSRLHFWRVAVDMVRDHPLGVGIRNYDSAYDRYDFSGGRFGNGRSVHSSHFQVLAELGFGGAMIWVAQFAYAFFACARIRSRSRHFALSEADRRFYFTMANALIVSMVGFLIGGAFIALALNDLTWISFALVAALDRLSARAISIERPTEPRLDGRMSPRTDDAPRRTPPFRGASRRLGLTLPRVLYTRSAVVIP